MIKAYIKLALSGYVQIQPRQIEMVDEGRKTFFLSASLPILTILRAYLLFVILIMFFLPDKIVLKILTKVPVLRQLHEFFLNIFLMIYFDAKTA